MRVISGTAKGMRLKAPTGYDVRPTSDMVREAIFDILGETPVGAHVLDLFAGTGALGIEALSRGAVSATLVDRSARNLSIIRENLAHTRLADRAVLIRADALAALGKFEAAGERFDLVLADPPYTDRRRDELEHAHSRGREGGSCPAEKALQRLAGIDILSSDAVVVIEHAARVKLPEEAGRLGLTTTRKYGRTSVSIYRLGE